MASSQLEDYKVIQVMSTNEKCSLYKVQNKHDGREFTWQAVSYDLDSAPNKRQFISEIDRLRKRKNRHLLSVSDFIYHNDSKTVYIVAEWCKYGSLLTIIQYCLKHQKYVDEPFVWMLLYRLVMLLKDNMCTADQIRLDYIFVDSEYNMKLLDSVMQCTARNEASLLNAVVQIGETIFRLCTLDENCSDVDHRCLPDHYSLELSNIMEFILNKSTIAPSLSSIIYHPTILLNCSSQLKCIYADVQYINCIPVPVSASDVLLSNLKMREQQLNSNVTKLKNREKQLRKRERKVALAERLAKDKVGRAELYLRQCRDKCAAKAESGDENIYENIESSVEKPACKPSTLPRSYSERRVRFRGHSPLKEIKNNRHHLATSLAEVQEKLQQCKVRPDSSDWSSETGSDKSESNLKLNVEEQVAPNIKKSLLHLMFHKKKKKPVKGLFQEDVTKKQSVRCENIESGQTCRPMIWTEGTKKQAFELLRAINEDSELCAIKHTYL